MRAFVEASVILDLLDGSPRGKAFEAHLARGDRELCFSPLVRMECRVRALAEDDGAKLARIEAIFATMNHLPLTDDVLERAALLRAPTGLKTPDALHVATALEHGCAELWTAVAPRPRVPAGIQIRCVAG